MFNIHKAQYNPRVNAKTIKTLFLGDQSELGYFNALKTWRLQDSSGSCSGSSVQHAVLVCQPLFIGIYTVIYNFKGN